MDIDLRCFAQPHRLGDSATYSPAPHSQRHAALRVLADTSLPRLHALPGAPITALAGGAVNCRFQVDRCPRLPYKRRMPI